MKRKTTITLTIAGLLGLAGMLYAVNQDFFKGVQGGPTKAPPSPPAPAATHFFFSNVHDPYPGLGAGPIGVAAAPADLIATEYCTNSNPALTNVDKIDCFGN